MVQSPKIGKNASSTANARGIPNLHPYVRWTDFFYSRLAGMFRQRTNCPAFALLPSSSIVVSSVRSPDERATHCHPDVGFLCPLPLPVFLEEDKGPDHDVLTASGVGGRGRVDTGSMKRPARDGAVGRRVIALEH
jgi:hypothetical protein